MARGKNNRRRASIDGPAPNMTTHNGNCSNPAQPAPPGTPTTHQEISEAIEFHWKNLSLDLKSFLLKNPQELSLRKFVGYWNNPVRVENTSPNIAASICGCSWYLALNYMTIGQVVEARALILNGCFLQQCYNKPIEEIATIASAISGNDFRENLPFFTDGLLAISSEERMTTFLRNKVSSDYQRRMSFATQTRQSKNKVQDYVNQISGDWNEGSVANKSSHKRNEARRRRASLDTLPADSFIEIKFIDSTCNNHEMKLRYGVGMGLKSLFKKYAEDRQLSLRQLRFTYEGRTLFLSSVGQKTPQDLNMKHLDSIMVIDSLAAAAALESEDSATSSSDESKENSKPTKSSRGNTKGGKKGRRKCQRRASWAGPEAIIGEEELLKLKHSRQLSRVFTEVAPQFELIRQQLNALNLVCTPPKVKRNRKKIPVSISPLPLVANPNDVGVGGKAGTPFYAVHVGEPDNLYNTAKNRRSLQQVQGQKSISIDLHGMTKEEALLELDAKLPGWIDIAMRGSYPWVIPAVIICGGGNQILSEAVDKWIKGNENVAKAPKKKFGRRRASV